MNLEGTIVSGDMYDAVEGRVVIEDGEIMAVEETATDSTDIVIPAFVNAHTHVGDAIAKEAGAGLTLAELVAPPDGLKHQLLRAADRADLIEAMTRALRTMQSTGTAGFIDFREGGVDGVTALQDAADGLAITPTILGRDDVDVLGVADGYGASSTADGEFGEARRATRNAGKCFGIHAGEADPGDVNGALDLDPDFLVHATHVEQLHLDRIEDGETQVVCCPRSNLATGVGLPPIAALSARTSVALGTDNVMINGPSMFREMELAQKHAGLPATDVLRMATRAGAELAGMNCGVIEPGRDAKLVVLDGDSDNLAGAQDVVRAVVRRAGAADVSNVIL